jgi:hypothetical protein
MANAVDVPSHGIPLHRLNFGTAPCFVASDMVQRRSQLAYNF